jgi:hypothetical protein
MWEQCAGAYDIPSAHEIDDDRAKEFFLPWLGAEDFFYHSVVCLCGHGAISTEFIFQLTRCR